MGLCRMFLLRCYLKCVPTFGFLRLAVFFRQLLKKCFTVFQVLLTQFSTCFPLEVYGIKRLFHMQSLLRALKTRRQTPHQNNCQRRKDQHTLGVSFFHYVTFCYTEIGLRVFLKTWGSHQNQLSCRIRLNFHEESDKFLL
jgi:hypothetical protein